MKKPHRTIILALALIISGIAGSVYYGYSKDRVTVATIVKGIHTKVPQSQSTNPSATHATSSTTGASTSTNSSPSTPESASSPVIATTPTEIVTADGSHYPIRHYTTSAYNDPAATQWWTQTISLPTLWNTTSSSGYIPTIAVIDTGFALNHEEFTNRWALNSADPVNGVDDDNNGYIDDWRGWDFAYNDNSPQTGTVNPNGDGVSHGTMTAGTAAATAGNGVGIAGVSQVAKILPVQAMTDDATGTSLTVGQGVLFAALHHADVISISLGTDADDPYLHHAIDYAIQQGSIVVASAGNSGCDCVSYPANYPEVVAVGSVNQAGALSSFSNYGANMDLLAPGENMKLPGWSSSFPTNGYINGAAGTSFSAPLVSGTLATLKALSPTATVGELIAALKENADHKTLSASSPHSSGLGFGVLNAGTTATRVTTASTAAQRYLLGPALTDDILGSSKVYSCQGAYPSAELFEIAGAEKGYSYSISELDAATAQANGKTVRSLGYQCVGQVTDHTPTLRSINLNRELH